MRRRETNKGESGFGKASDRVRAKVKLEGWVCRHLVFPVFLVYTLYDHVTNHILMSARNRC